MTKRYLCAGYDVCVGKYPEYTIHLKPIPNCENKFKIEFKNKKQLDKLFEEYPIHFRQKHCKYDIILDENDDSIAYLLLEFDKNYNPKFQECVVSVSIKSDEDGNLAKDIYEQLNSQVKTYSKNLETHSNKGEEINI